MGTQKRNSQKRRSNNARPAYQKPSLGEPVAPKKETTIIKPDEFSPEISSRAKRITFTVSEELHKKAFILARRQGITIKDFLTNYLEQETAEEKV